MPEHPLEISHLVYRYQRAERPAVEGLDFTVAHGEILGLLGPNGAGKTTTLHAILGLLTPTAGSVKVFGCSPIRERSRVMPRLNFASVDVDLPSNLLVAECLRIFAKLYGVHRDVRHSEELMERFRLIEVRRQRIGTLSAGEQMRLKLCKALLNRPDLLILDEPTLNLDPYMAQTVRELLKTIQRERGMTILHTSHNMQEVESFCDRILFLHQGRKLAEGSPSEVLARFGSRSLDELFIRVATSGELFHAP
jgi:ABC-2 type transport system ATP-binding protein